MNLYSDLNIYLIRFCSEKALKGMVLVNKEFSILSVIEIKERASRKLDVSENGLPELPKYYPKGHLCKGEEIDYSKIEYLNCSGNHLTSLPDCLVNCEYLNCSWNQLTSLPDCLVNCEVLGCRYNQLTSLPDGSNGLKNCRELDCSHNKLTFLPDNLEKCEILDCSSNYLSSFPDYGKNRPRGFLRCRTMNCNFNYITLIPDYFFNCNLHCLCNPISEFPPPDGYLAYIDITDSGIFNMYG